VVGASPKEGKVGRVVLENILRSGYPGRVYPVNPNHRQVLGRPCFPSLKEVPGTTDLAVVIVPAPAVEGVIRECGEKSIAAAVIITAGFKETGGEGYRRERSLKETASRLGVRILGPNCLGIADTYTPLNATFANRQPLQGEVAFMSQSGALCTAVLGWAEENRLGFSRFISLGNKADLNECDFLEALAADPHTKIIAAYLEGVEEGRRFLETAWKVSRKKPVVVFKAGTTEAGARAVSSHTGTLAGSERSYQAAFLKGGVIRAFRVEELFMLAKGFVSQALPPGRRVAVITNAGGPGIIASDALEREGFQLASLQKETIRLLRDKLPPAAGVFNPVDVLGDAGASRYREAVAAVMKDPGVDALLVVLTPQAMTEVRESAQAVVEETRGVKKPVLAVFMGGEEIREGERVLEKGGIPNFPFPEDAVKTLGAMRDYAALLVRKPPTITRFEVDRERAQRVLDSARKDNRLELGEVEAREVLAAYGIPVARTILATNLEECIRAGRNIGYPVVLKIASPQILHKTDVGGVVVNIADTDSLIDAYQNITARVRRLAPEAEIWGVLVQEMLPPSRELILGMNRDPQFGPLVMLGLGGIYVEVLKDVSFRLAPLGREDVMEMLRELKSYWLLQGARGEPPADVGAVVEVTLRVSQMAEELPELEELDINPLRVMEKGKGCLAADARMVLRE
jgi:acetyltransferase